jgi:hypothetical protein
MLIWGALDYADNNGGKAPTSLNLLVPHYLPEYPKIHLLPKKLRPTKQLMYRPSMVSATATGQVLQESEPGACRASGYRSLRTAQLGEMSDCMFVNGFGCRELSRSDEAPHYEIITSSRLEYDDDFEYVSFREVRKPANAVGMFHWDLSSAVSSKGGQGILR